jgi:5-methyltetrahydrofolate--homocysteine methyltransferase
MDKLKQLTNHMRELEGEEVMQGVTDMLDQGVEPLQIVDALQQGMAEVGDLFSKGEYFLSELIVTGEILKNAMDVLEPKITGARSETKGTVVVGTVKDDIHDLGKNIVVMLLKGAGYEVIDLGVDVPKEKFVEALKESSAPLVGISVLLTSCQENVKETIDDIRAAGLTDVKVMIGGNYVDNRVMEYSGADYFGDRADVAVTVAKKVFNS